MGKNFKRRAIDNIKFSIGFKLITIISIIVIISLGSITALVSWLVQEDLRISAEENNLETNRRSSIEAETAIANMRSNSRILLRTINAVESLARGRDDVIARDTIEYFFLENPQIGAVFYVSPGKGEQLYANPAFFSSRGLVEQSAGIFFREQRIPLSRAVRGETLLNNAAPYFSRAFLVLYFPFATDDSADGVAAVLFSSENLNNNFGFGVNQSIMMNSDGDILAASDFSVLQSGVNLAGEKFIYNIVSDSQKSRQQLIRADFSFMEVEDDAVKTGFINSLWDKADVVWYNAVELWDNATELASKYIPAFKPVEKPSDQTIEKRYFLAYTKLNIAGAIVITSIEYNKVFEGIATTTRRNIYLSVAVLCVSVIFIWFFAKTISLPLRSLAMAARQIEGGQFLLELETAKRKDEIGVLFNSFKKMSSALHIFGRFTNKEIAIKAMKGEIKPGGFPKHATIFFSDIRNFTALSEQFTIAFGRGASDRIVSWLNDYLTHMVECVEKTNGVVDKFIGDAVMAHWGTAYSAGSPRLDAFNCVKAALMMRKALYFMNRERTYYDPGNPVIRIGCGINTGIVTAGQLGSDMRMEYTVIGDPVNLASRIEALTKPLGADILISEDTWKLIGDKFVTEEMPSVTVKGKEKPVRIFAVVNFLGETKGPQTINDVRRILNIEYVDVDSVDVNADEKKYKIEKPAPNYDEPEELIDSVDLLEDLIDIDE